MKKIITITLAICLIASLTLSASAVTIGNWGETNYGVTEPVERTITYDYDGGWTIQRTGWRWKVITSMTYESNGTHIVSDIVPWRYGYTFVGWLHPNGVIYQSGDLLQGVSDVTLIAQWQRR